MPAQTNVQMSLKSQELFRSLSFDEVAAVSTFSSRKEYDAGGFVFERGGYGSHFFTVIEGQVNLKLASTDRTSGIVVARLTAGHILGLSPLLGFERFTTTAICAEPTSVLAVEVAPFRRLLQDNAAVGLSVMNVVARAYFSRYIETLQRIQGVLDELAAV